MCPTRQNSSLPIDHYSRSFHSLITHRLVGLGFPAQARRFCSTRLLGSVVPTVTDRRRISALLVRRTLAWRGSCYLAAVREQLRLFLRAVIRDRDVLAFFQIIIVSSNHLLQRSLVVFATRLQRVFQTASFSGRALVAVRQDFLI